MAQEKSNGGITIAVTDFLAGLRLSGSERVLGALALALAEGMENAPLYAGEVRPRTARILGDLSEAEVSPANLSLFRGIDL